MHGLGTIINVVAIIIGGIVGLLFGRFIPERHRDALCKACGLSVIFIGVAGTLQNMFSVENGRIVYGGDFLIIGCLAVGALIGELINIEDSLERFGEWLKKKTKSSSDNRFTEGFMTASLTVSIGAMAIVGAINDGIYGNYSILVTKAILDFIIIMIMAASLGKGTVFSAIPVGVLQGSVTALAVLMQPLMTPTALLYLSVIGNILIFCVGINLVFGKKIRVANLLPAVVLAVVCAFLPISLF